MSNKTPLFAAYLNMARHNVYITLSHIHQLLGYKPVDESQIEKAKSVEILANTDEIEKVEKAIELFNKHFPFLRAMLDNEISQRAVNKNDQLFASLADYNIILTDVFGTLSRLRNQYSHYNSQPARSCSIKLKFCLENCFDASRRKVKERFNLDDHDVKHLMRKLGKRDNPHFYYHIIDNKQDFSDNGLAFFICLFLEKKYASLFLNKLSNFKRSDIKSMQATKEAYSIYRIIIPKLRIDSEKNEITLGIDMLNELKRCPSELYDQLNPKDSARFRVPISNMSGEDSEDEEVLLLRSKNRFPYFALNYIDQNHLFDRLRFHVDLGMHRHTFYPKRGIDNVERTRIIQNRLLGFGRLLEIEKRRRQDLNCFIPNENNDIPENTPYITDTYAHYHIKNNRIGIKTKDSFPDLTKKKNDAPDMWLSLYEMPAVIFHLLLNDGKGDKTQGIIISYYERYQKLFKAVANKELTPEDELSPETFTEKYKLKFNQIPKELQDFISGKNITDNYFNRLSEAKIHEMLEDTERRIESIDKKLTRIKSPKSNRLGKDGFAEIKSGKLADFLAEDILYFQPTKDNGRDKVTGMNYQILQASLAFYGEKCTEMKNLFIECGLLESSNNHPFLNKMNLDKCKNIVDFYKTYLMQRRSYLIACSKEKKYKSYHFLRPNRKKWDERNNDFYIQLANRYLEQSIELPRGFLTDEIKKCLLKFNNEDMNNTINTASEVNTVFLIQCYCKYIIKDNPQDFYNFKRTYRVFNKIYDSRTERNKFKPLENRYYSAIELEKESVKIREKVKKDESLKHLYDEYMKNEKQIRLCKIHDILLFLMAKNLLFKKLGELNDYKLDKIMPDSERDILSKQTSMKMKYGNKVIRQEKMTLKKYGDFLRFTKDRRMNSLMQLTKSDIINREDLEKELEIYDMKRAEIMVHILDLEKSVIESNGHSGNNTHFPNILKQVPELNAQDGYLMQIIRNAYCHNQYPTGSESIDDFTKTDNGKITLQIPLQSMLDTDIPEIATKIDQLLTTIVNKYKKS